MLHLSMYSLSLLIYLFLFGPFQRRDGCVLSATLCLISTFPPVEKSFVWRYLLCEIVRVSCRRAFLTKYGRSDLNACNRKESKTPSHPPPPPSPLVSCFLILHFAAFSNRRNFFTDTVWNPSSGAVFYFLITLFKRTFNHTPPAV